MKISVHNPNNLPVIDYRKIEAFQGNLKDLKKPEFDMLLKSLKEQGFFVPFYIWEHDGKPYALDGHQRLRVLKKSKVQPYKLPYINIEADTEEDARKKLLLISSQFGKITEDGFQEFTAEMADDWVIESVSFDGLFKVIDVPDPETKKKKVERDIVVTTEVLEEYRELAGYKTAIERPDGSQPTQFLREKKLLIGDILDYGCGKEQHQDIIGFDPYYQPHYTTLEHVYDTIICNYVLNVIPLKHNRYELVRTVMSLLNYGGKAYFSVYGKDSVDTRTDKGYQSGYSKSDWYEFLSSIYPTTEIPADFWLYCIEKPE